MNKTILFFIILFIIGGALFYAYTIYDPQEVEYYNLSISSQYDKERIKTQIEIDGMKINTSQVYEQLTLAEGVYYIKNQNINEQNFYEEEIKLNLTENRRLDIFLEKPKNPEIDVISDKPLVVEIYSEMLKEVDFCLRGSISYIFITPIGNYTKIEKPEEYAEYEKCYDGGFSLEDSSYYLNISYEEFGIPNEDDFIELLLIDKAENTIIESIK